MPQMSPMMWLAFPLVMLGLVMMSLVMVDEKSEEKWELVKGGGKKIFKLW